MNASLFKKKGVDYVSARAESQVQNRTKIRFCQPGAWRQENLEGKAILRSIIAEGKWEPFRKYYLDKQRTLFQTQFYKRIEKAIGDGRISVI